MTPEKATNIAIAALQYMSTDEQLLGRFLDLSGLNPASMRQAAQSEAFLVAILEYFMNDESGLLAFAATNGLDPADVARAKVELDSSTPADDWP